MPILAIILCGLLSRIDGWGRGDGLFPIHPFNKLKTGGFNYARYFIGFVVWGITGNPIYILSFGLAVSIVWGEKHWWMKYGIASWFFIGAVWGGAAGGYGFIDKDLAWGMALWMGMFVSILKFLDTNHAYFEFLIGAGSVLWLVFR